MIRYASVEVSNASLFALEAFQAIKWLVFHELLLHSSPPFLQYLQSKDSILKTWAIRGLQKLNTKEARRALWEAGLK